MAILEEHYLENNLGFVNADGSGETYITNMTKLGFFEFKQGGPIFPIITTDDSTLVYRIPGSARHAGELVVFETGHSPFECSTEGFERPSTTSHPNQMVIDTVDVGWNTLVLYDISACRKGLKAGIVEVYDEETIGHNPGYGALSPDKRFLAYGRDYAYMKAHPEVDPRQLFVFDLENGTEVLVGSGINPAWSPDGEWLAYTRLVGIGIVSSDGIFVVRYDGTEGRKVVNPNYTEWWPQPSWSADGKWLTYHKCILPEDPGNLCKERYHFAIFVLNLETGEETKIVDGGLNPFWRWRETIP
jgi:hypothetical protein